MSSTTQEIRLNGTLPEKFKLVIVPFYGTATEQTEGSRISVTQEDVTAPGTAISIPLLDADETPLISVSVIYQMGCVLNCIPGISIPADNRPINLHFIQTGCVTFLTVSEPLNNGGLSVCCDIHA